MNCNAAQTQLSSFIDGELSGNSMQALRSHIASCAECDREYQMLRAVKQAMASIPEIEPPAGFEERLISTVFASKSAPARRQLRLVWAAGVTFAAGFAISLAYLNAGKAQQLEATNQSARSNFQLAKDQAYVAGSDPFTGNAIVLTSTHGNR